MSERTDHAAAAHAWLERGEATYGYPNNYMTTQTDAHHFAIADQAAAVAIAQVHATLALVEQQRIANLIAIAQASDGSLPVVARDLAYLGLVCGGPDGMFHEHIREGLGL